MKFLIFLEGVMYNFVKKIFFLMCYKDTFFDTSLPLPIKFLNPDISLKKGDNDILVEISLDKYSIEFSYSINI